MKTHQNFMKCQEDVLLKHIRFIKSPQDGSQRLDIASLTALTLVNSTAHEGMKSLYDKHSYDTIVVADESDLLYAQPLALRSTKGLVIVREMSGLPCRAICETYPAGNEIKTLELAENNLDPNNKVLIVSNMLATRQKVAALVRLIRRTGAKVVGIAALVSLDYLAQAEIPDNIPVRAVLSYDRPPLD